MRVEKKNTVCLGHILHIYCIFTVYPVCVLYTFGNFLSLLLHYNHIAGNTVISVESYKIIYNSDFEITLGFCRGHQVKSVISFPEFYDKYFFVGLSICSFL